MVEDARQRGAHRLDAVGVSDAFEDRLSEQHKPFERVAVRVELVSLSLKLADASGAVLAFGEQAVALACRAFAQGGVLRRVEVAVEVVALRTLDR